MSAGNSNGGVSIQRDASARQEESGKETNELALVSMALGIFWIFGLGSIAAMYLGRKALVEIAKPERHESGRAFAWAGIASGIFGLMSTGLVVAVALTA